MKKYILYLLLATVSVNIQASGRTDAQMLTIARSKLSAPAYSKGHETSAPAAIRLVKEEKTYSIYAADNTGFVIVSRDDRLAPVIGYSYTNFDADNMPCCFKWWLANVTRSMEKIINEGKPCRQVAKSSNTAVVPLMTTKWHQSSPFNMYAPIIKVNGKDQQAPAGCVAIAMAQILNYNQYPVSASFEGRYYANSSSTPVTESVSSTYAWPYMDAYGYYFPDGYASEDDMQNKPFTPKQAQAVAALARDCGYSVDMKYNVNGSGAYSEEAASAFINCFGYPEETVKLYARAFFSDDEWMEKISEELRRGYPVMYSGSDSEYGGHAFVVHGMDNDGLAYVNWGWQGMYDGYYAMELMDAGGEQQFSDNQGIVTNIHPAALATDAVESLMATDAPYRFSYDNGSHELTITFVEGIYNYTPLTMKGRFCLVMEDVTENTTIYEDLLDEEDMEEGVPSLYGFGAQSFGDVFEFEAGHSYRLYLATKDEREAVWQPVRTIGGPISYALTVSDSGTVTIDEEPAYTGVGEVRTSETGTSRTEFYTMDGRRTNSATKGLVIVKQGNIVNKIVR